MTLTSEEIFALEKTIDSNEVFGFSDSGPVDPNPPPEFDIASHMDFSDRLGMPVLDITDTEGHYKRATEVWDLSEKLNMSVTLVDQFYPFLKAFKPDPVRQWNQRYSWQNDVGRAIDETPRNLYIGVLTGSAGVANAFKREGMRWAGGFGLIPDEIVKHQFQPVPVTTPLPAPPPGILDLRGPVPGAIVGEAFAVATRAPDAIARILNAEAQSEQSKQDKIDIKTSPVARLLRPVSQNAPLYGVALGLGVLTGDSALTLGILGGSEGGNAFAKQLDEGGSILKAQFFGDLSMAAEIGGEMLVAPKIIKGYTKGIPLREVVSLIAINAGQEGVTGYTQTFLEVFASETTKGTSYKKAIAMAHEAGIKAVPENAWVGGVLAGGAVVPTVRSAQQQAQQARRATIVEQANKDIADIHNRYTGLQAEHMAMDRIARAKQELDILQGEPGVAEAIAVERAEDQTIAEQIKSEVGTEQIFGDVSEVVRQYAEQIKAEFHGIEMPVFEGESTTTKIAKTLGLNLHDANVLKAIQLAAIDLEKERKATPAAPAP